MTPLYKGKKRTHAQMRARSTSLLNASGAFVGDGGENIADLQRSQQTERCG